MELLNLNRKSIGLILSIVMVKKNFHYYNASDVPFNDNEVKQFMKEVIEAGYKILEISTPFTHLLSIGRKSAIERYWKRIEFFN
jgi:hypothetical protein